MSTGNLGLPCFLRYLAYWLVAFYFKGLFLNGSNIEEEHQKFSCQMMDGANAWVYKFLLCHRRAHVYIYIFILTKMKN